MVLNKNLKIIIVSLLSVAAYIQARSVPHLEDIRVERTDDKWICDMIECPLNSSRCFVSISNEAEPSVLERVNICYGEDNKILEQKNSSSPTNPNYRIRQRVDSSRSGSTVSSHDKSSVNFDEKEYNLNMDIDVKNLFKDFEERMQNRMNAMEKYFKNIFG